MVVFAELPLIYANYYYYLIKYGFLFYFVNFYLW